VFENAVDPQFDHSFEIPVRANQQESDLILEVVHKEAFFSRHSLRVFEAPQSCRFCVEERNPRWLYSPGSQTSQPFGVQPVPIDQLLPQRQGTMPNFVQEC